MVLESLLSWFLEILCNREPNNLFLSLLSLSLSLSEAMPYMDMYNATKFAMEGLTESLLPQLKHFGIRYVIPHRTY